MLKNRVAARVVVARVASIVAAASAISEGVYLPSPTRAHRLRSPRARSPPPDKKFGDLSGGR